MPIAVHIKENPAGFHRFDSVWTPTALVLDENGKERHRIEGYLPKDEFAAQLLLGLARVAFMQKKWGDAEKIYDEILLKYPNSEAAPESIYWKSVSQYKGKHDHTCWAKRRKPYSKNIPTAFGPRRQFLGRPNCLGKKDEAAELILPFYYFAYKFGCNTERRSVVPK